MYIGLIVFEYAGLLGRLRLGGEREQEIYIYLWGGSGFCDTWSWFVDFSGAYSFLVRRWRRARAEFLGCNEACRGRMAHRPGSRCDPPFTDSCGPSGWWLVVLCSQQCVTTYNFNYRGEGFRAFLKVGEGDAGGQGCVSVLAPCGAYYVGLYNVVPNLCGV